MSTFGAARNLLPGAQAALAKRAQVQYTKHVYFHGSVHVAQGEFAYVRQFAHAVLSYGRAPVALIDAFFLYSFLGWCMECVVIRREKGEWENRGFVRSPFCIIYGFGAMLGYALLRPFAGNYVVLYVVGAVAATAFEYLTALLMLKLFGTFWWDYTNKPFNYRGIICLESTLGWGLSACCCSLFMQKRRIHRGAPPFAAGGHGLCRGAGGAVCGRFCLQHAPRFARGGPKRGARRPGKGAGTMIRRAFGKWGMWLCRKMKNTLRWCATFWKTSRCAAWTAIFSTGTPPVCATASMCRI